MTLLTEEQKENLKADLIIGAFAALTVGSYVFAYKCGRKKGNRKGFIKGYENGFGDGAKAFADSIISNPGVYTTDSGVYAFIAKQVGSTESDLIASLIKAS